jgi:hypothetical protein
LLPVARRPRNFSEPAQQNARRAKFRSTNRIGLDEASCKVGELMQAHGLTTRPYELTITASAPR